MPKLKKKNSTALTPAQFLKLSNRQQRIAIIKDAVQQVKLGVYKPKRGTYAETDGTCPIEQEALTSTEPPRCTVCETGALLVSLVRLNNKLDQYAVTGSTVLSRLAPHFSQSELALVEAAFEKTIEPNLGRRQGFYPYEQAVPVADRKRARNFGRRYSTDRKRTLGIFRNMLRNKGTFKP